MTDADSARTGALDSGEDNPDLLVGEQVEPEHDLDPATFSVRDFLGEEEFDG